MSKTKDTSVTLANLRTLGWPILGGIALTAAFYAALHSGWLRFSGGAGGDDLMQRYFAGHFVEYTETTLFFIGVAALVLKAWDVLGQFSLVRQFSLDDGPVKARAAADAAPLLEWIELLPSRVTNSYLGRRFHDALLFVHRMNGAERLDEELKYLADLDSVRQQESYGLVRILVWATPMLGFLGTVIGITMALGGLSPEALVNSPQDAMKGLLAGLSVAFDTTALALALSITLMFAQFLLQQIEGQLLTAVDLKANEELIGRFENVGGSNDPLAAALHRMGQSVMQSCDGLVKRQADLWRETVDASRERWERMADQAGDQLQTALAGSLQESLKQHAAVLSQTEQQTAAAWRTEAAAWREAMGRHAELVTRQQTEMSRQGEMLTRTMEAVGEVTRLEAALNRNLETLAGASHFEETVMSLAAAIQLLSARVHGGEGVSRVQLQGAKGQERAA